VERTQASLPSKLCLDGLAAGGPKRRISRKILVGIDEEKLEVRTVEAMSRNVSGVPMLSELHNQIPFDQDIGSLSADGAYDTRKCQDSIAARSAHAVIQPRKDPKSWKSTSPGAIARNEARYLGRVLWRRWSEHHRRSRVETKMHRVKLKGKSLMARDLDRQIAKIHICLAILNR